MEKSEQEEIAWPLELWSQSGSNTHRILNGPNLYLKKRWHPQVGPIDAVMYSLALSEIHLKETHPLITELFPLEGSGTILGL